MSSFWGRVALWLWFWIPGHMDILSTRDSDSGMAFRDIALIVSLKGIVHISNAKGGFAHRLNSEAIL